MPSPYSATGRLSAGSSSIIFASRLVAITLGAALGGHRGLLKNSGGNGFDVSGIPGGIQGLLPQILYVKAQQPQP